MSLKAQAAGLGIGVAVIAAGLWYVKRKASSALSTLGTAVTTGAAAGWDAAQAPVIDPTLPGASIGNGIVAAPSNLLDAASLGLISGDGGNTGNGGILAWMENIVSGNAFAPKQDTSSLDFGTGSNTWND